MIITVSSGSDLRARFNYLLNRDGSVVSVPHRDVSERTMMNLASSMDRKVKFFSVMVSFSPEDTEKVQKNRDEILNDLLDLLFEGYKERPLVHVTEHRDTQHVHWHITILNDVGGKDSRFYFHRRDKAWIAAVQDYLDAKWGLTSPRENLEAFAKSLKAHYSHLFAKNAEVRSREYLRRELYGMVAKIASSGAVADREELVRFLQGMGLKVVRKGKNYITVMHKGKRVRLKGGVFNEAWRAEQTSTGSKISASRTDGKHLENLRAEIFRAGQKRFRALEQLNSKVAYDLPAGGSDSWTGPRLGDVGAYLKPLRDYLSSRRGLKRKSLSASSRALKEERWRQLSQLATTREHEDLLQKTSRLAEELVEQLVKKRDFHLPKDLFTFHIGKHEEEYDTGGMAI